MRRAIIPTAAALIAAASADQSKSNPFAEMIDDGPTLAPQTRAERRRETRMRRKAEKRSTALIAQANKEVQQ